MEYVQILKTCSENLSNCCNDYAIAKFLYIIKTGMTYVQFIAPIILIVMATISLAQMVINPDDQNKAKSQGIKNKFISAIIIFFIPVIMNVLLGMLSNSFEVAACWDAAEDMIERMEVEEAKTE